QSRTHRERSIPSPATTQIRSQPMTKKQGQPSSTSKSQAKEKKRGGKNAGGSSMSQFPRFMSLKAKRKEEESLLKKHQGHSEDAGKAAENEQRPLGLRRSHLPVLPSELQGLL